MDFNQHSNLVGQHAFLSASKYHWLNYDVEKLKTTFRKQLAVQMGTRLHAFAAECISLRQRLQKSKKTLNMFVNDAIGFKMTPEQPLYYSENCFGTADAISFTNNLLRIHDLKTGETPASMAQLEIYTALFCLEYSMSPSDINIELRIYQSDDIVIHSPDSMDIREIMDKIIFFDKAIQQLKMEEL